MASQQYTESPESTRPGSERYNLRPRGPSATTASATTNDKGHKSVDTEEAIPSQAATYKDRFGLVDCVPQKVPATYWPDCKFAFPALIQGDVDVTIKSGAPPTCDACFDLAPNLAQGTADFEPHPVSVIGYSREAGTELKQYPAGTTADGYGMTVRRLCLPGDQMRIIAFEGDLEHKGSGKDMKLHGEGQFYRSEVMSAELPERLVRRAISQNSQTSMG